MWDLWDLGFSFDEEVSVEDYLRFLDGEDLIDFVDWLEGQESNFMLSDW